MRKIFCVFLSVLLLLTCFSACKDSGSPSEDSPVTLTVLTEVTNGLGLLPAMGAENYLHALDSVIHEFNLTHTSVQIKKEVLGWDKSSSKRDIQIQNLQTELMAGKGPDVFLLPAGVTAGEKGALLESIFPDVEMAMKNFYFADLSDYYDADEELKTEELQQDIMDVGVLDGARYVLPLGWNMPIVAVNLDKIEEFGFTQEDFSLPFPEFLRACAGSGGRGVVAGTIFNYTSLCFSELFDYEKETVAVTQELLKDTVDSFSSLFEHYQSLDESITYVGLTARNVATYLSQDGAPFHLSSNLPFCVADLYQATDLIAMAKCEEEPLVFYPLRSGDGSTVAEVTFYGAVNANCEYPEEAYEFLRMLLTPEVQFQTGYGKDETTALDECDIAWPVRVKDSVEQGWKARMRWIRRLDNSYQPERWKELIEVSLTEEDVPLFDGQIDHVRFRTSLDASLMGRNWLLRPDCAGWTMEQLKYHIAES